MVGVCGNAWAWLPRKAGDKWVVEKSALRKA